MKSYEKLLAFYKQYVILNVYMGNIPHDHQDEDNYDHDDYDDYEEDLWTQLLVEQFSTFVENATEELYWK